MKVIKNFFYRNKFIIAAFFLPVIIMSIALIIHGIYPFGENQIAVIDMYHQYVPFLSELQYKMQHGGSLFYTWNGGGGSNFWCLLAYYGASPVNILLMLFPGKYIMEAVTLILLVKIGFAGCFMYINLSNQRVYDGTLDTIKDSSIVTLVFSTLYALNSFVMGYYWCIMWIDAVALLPLAIMGMRRIISGNGIALYTITIGLIVFTNYYISIMVCIFIMFYYPVMYFTRPEGTGNGVAKTTFRAVGCSLLGIGLACVMLIPTTKAMQNAYYISSDMPQDVTFYYDPIDIINQLLPNAHLTFRNGLPNLYCGMLIVILLAVYVLCKGIKTREKVIYAAFLVFMFFGLNVNKLDFIWHGFHFPNELPHRYTFVICFVLICMAYKALGYIESISVKTIYAIMAVGTAYYLIAQKILKDKLDDANMFFYLGMALLVAYVSVIALSKKGRIKRNEMVILIAAIVVAEMFCNTNSSLDSVGNTARYSYNENQKSMTKLVDYANNQEFARMETNSDVTINEPARLHFKGISQFSSSLNCNTTALMEAIGIEGEPGKNRFNYNLTNPVTDAMLNIKYILSKNSGIENDNYEVVKKAGYSRLYQNKYPLSIGYMVPHGIRTWCTDDDNPFYNLDDYARAVSGGEIVKLFDSLGKADISSSYASASYTTEDYIEVYPNNTDKQINVNLKYKAPRDGNCYVCIETTSAESITVRRKDVAKNTEIEKDCNSIVNVGCFKKGEEFTVDILYEEGKSGCITSHVSMMNEKKWDELYKMLSRNMLEVTDYSDTYIKGRVTTDYSGVLVTSIPYDDGWSMTIDGKKRKITEKTGDVWISTGLNPGTHEIELKFRPPGFILGLMVTIVSILILIGIEILTYKKKNPQAATEDEELEFFKKYESYMRHDDMSVDTTDDISSNGI